MEVFNGSDLILMVHDGANDYKPVAHARSHQLTVTRTIRPVSSKSSGDAEENEYGRYNWSISVEGFTSYITDIANFDFFLEKQLTKDKVDLLSVLLDYETSGKAPLDDATDYVVRDATGNDNIDSATTTIETTDDNFAMTSVISTITPKANWGEAVIETVEKTGGDDDNPTFSISFKGNGPLYRFDIAAYA